jgi:hypothetical protein
LSDGLENFSHIWGFDLTWQRREHMNFICCI